MYIWDCILCVSTSVILFSICIIQTLYVRQTAYEVLVRPTLEYATCAWAPYTKTDIQITEDVQLSAACFVAGDYRRTSILQLAYSGYAHNTNMVSVILRTLYSTMERPKGPVMTSRFGRAVVPGFLIPTFWKTLSNFIRWRKAHQNKELPLFTGCSVSRLCIVRQKDGF